MGVGPEGLVVGRAIEPAKVWGFDFSGMTLLWGRWGARWGRNGAMPLHGGQEEGFLGGGGRLLNHMFTSP